MDENLPVIFDIGSLTSKIGVADQKPTVISKSELETSGIEYPIERGNYENMEQMVKLWNYFYFKLKIRASKQPAILTMPHHMPLDNKKQALEIFFEKMNVPAFHMDLQPLLAMHAYNKNTGQIVESGEGSTQQVPIWNGFILKHAMAKIDFSGQDITQHLKENLEEKKLLVTYENCQKIKEKQNIPESQYSSIFKYLNTADYNDFKLPDDYVIDLKDMRKTCLDAFFSQTKTLDTYYGIHQAIHTCIDKCDIDIRRDLYKNIYLSGGNTLFEGISTRLHHELAEIIPKNVKIDITKNKNAPLLAYYGASTLCINVQSFENVMITKDKYDDYGKERLCLEIN